MHRRVSSKTVSGNIGIYGILCLVAVGLNYSVLSGGWRWDDTAHLLHVQSYSILNDFINPEIWQQFSPANLTPWLPLSYEVDLILFGLNVSLYYLHQLIALSTVAFALYYLLHFWTKKRFAFLGSCLFLTGAPVLVVAQQLMTRHYIEGLVFCLLSLIFFVLYLRQRSISLIVVSAFFYLLSVTAKEIYVPLVILIFFIPEQNIKTRLRAASAHIAIAILYAFWRAYMLDNLGGGYVDSSNYLSVAYITSVVATFLTFPGLLFGGYWPIFVATFVTLMAVYAIVARSNLLFSLIVAALILIPLVPLVSFPGILIADRYLLLPWTATCFAIAFYGDRVFAFLENVRGNYLSYSVYIVFSLVTAISIISGINVRTPVEEVGKEFDAHANFIWQNDNLMAFIPSGNLLASYWFVTGLASFKSQITRGGTAPISIVDAIYLDPAIPGLWRYDASCHCMRESEESVLDMISAHESNIVDNVPLQLDFEYQNGYFSWEFGPYDDGQYHVVSDTIGVIPAPRSGALRVNLDEGTPIYLRYTSPAGWVTYSELQYVYRDVPPVRWQRDLN